MIKVLLHGQLMSQATCPRCGCKFIFTTDETSMMNKEIGESYLFVKCPDCEAEVKSDRFSEYSFEQEPATLNRTFITPVKNYSDWIDTSAYKGCEDCEFYRNTLKSGQIYVGDTPCEWCSHNPYKITCTSTNSTPPQQTTIINDYMKGKREDV